MAANGVEIGSVYVSILAKMPGVAKSINAAIGGVDTSSSGKKIGQQLAAGMGKSLKSQVTAKFAEATAAALDKSSMAAKKLADAEHALVKARAQHGTSAAKVTAAEAKLEKLRGSGSASAADLEAAEAALAKAQADSAGTSRAVASAKNTVAEASRNAADAANEYTAALAKEQSAGERATAWMPLANARIDEVAGKWQSAGASISGIGATLTSKITKPVAVAGGAVATLVGALGFKRLVGIDTARGQFQGLGMDADAVMKQVDKGVTDTSLSMATGASLAVGILATGAVPLEGLEAQIKRVANVSAAYNVEGEHAAYLLNNVLSKNKVTYGDLSQMVQNQIPIITQLAEHYGVTGGEIQKMANSGEISIETLNEVLDKNAGSAAESYAKTWRGVTSNILSNLGKLGAKFLEPTFNIMKDEAAGFLELLRSDDFSALAADIGTKVGEAVTRVSEAVQGLVGWWSGLSDGQRQAILTAAGVAVAMGPVLKVVGLLTTGVGKAIAVGKVAVGLFTGWKVAAGGAALGSAALTGATKAQTVAMKAGAVAQKLLNASLWASPITWIVAGIAAVVAGLVLFFTKTETGKEVWANFTQFLGEAWANISAVFTTVWETVLKPIFDGIATVATWVFETILKPAFDGVQIAFSILAGIFQGVWESVLKPVFDAVGKIVSWLWETIVMPYFGLIMGYFKLVGTIISWLWTNVVSPVFNFIGGLIKTVWEGAIQPALSALWGFIKNTLGPVFTWLKSSVIDPIWNGIKATIANVWTNGIKPIIDALVRVIQSDPKRAFEAARDAIGTAWAGIQELAKKPVRFVIDTVINGLIGTVNKLPGVNIPKVPLPKGFARGGILPGMSRMSDGDDQLIMARRGEGMLVSEALRTPADRSAFLAANAAGRKGVGFASMLQGLARGGLVNPLPKGSYNVSQPYHGGHNGIDLAAPSGTKIMAAGKGIVGLASSVPMGGNEIYIQHDNGLGTRYSHLSGFNTSVGAVVRPGQQIGTVGSTGMSTGPHLHYMVHAPGGGAGNYGNHVNPASYMGVDGEAWSILDGLVDWAGSVFKKAFPDSDLWVDIAGGLMKDAVKQAVAGISGGFGTDTGTTLYDSGGWLPTGTSLVENRSGRPEPILTASQWDSLLETRAPQSMGRQRLRLVLEDGSEFGAYIDDRADARAQNMMEAML